MTEHVLGVAEWEGIAIKSRPLWNKTDWLDWLDLLDRQRAAFPSGVDSYVALLFASTKAASPIRVQPCLLWEAYHARKPDTYWGRNP